MRRRAAGLPVRLALIALVGCGRTSEPSTVDSPRAGEYLEDDSAPGWPGWGGPGGDFKVEAADLAAAWPTDGPPLLWSRPLGEGYSAIAADRGALYTMYREGDDDVVVALRADDGTTVWEHRYAAPTREANVVQFGKGPNATPLVLDDRVITLGYAGALHCLEARTGAMLWSHDLIEEPGGEVLSFGYSASPILHDGNVIVLVGGRQAVVAFKPSDGTVAWHSASGSVSYSTPIAIDVDGQAQIVYFSADKVNGIAAAGGTALWSHEVVNEYRNNSTGPSWDGRLLWAATQLDGGARVLKLTRDGDRTEVEEVWNNPKISIHYWNTMRLDGHVYASIGSNASVLAAIDMVTGEIKWRERGFQQVNFVQAGDKTILFDSEGELALATLTPEGILIHARATIAEGPTWTPPTLLGTKLYIRDKHSIRALELGAS